MVTSVVSSARISVCIPAYNDAVAFARALDSVLQQGCPNLECVVSDDSTTDAIAQVVVERQDARVRYMRNRPSLGVPANWNAVLEAATGRVLTLLHQDDFYCSDTVIDTVLKAMECQHAQVAVCSFSAWRAGIKMAHYDRHLHQVASFLRHYPHRSLVVNRIGHPSVIFVDASLKALRFDERLCYFLDTDWYAALWRAANRVVYVPSAEVGMESGRNGQLSGKCIQHMRVVVEELDVALEKARAGDVKRAQAMARLVASHARHWSAEANQALLRLWRPLSTAGKVVFAAVLVGCLVHMGYRFLHKKLGLGPWR